jgi:hypothetical protein
MQRKISKWLSVALVALLMVSTISCLLTASIPERAKIYDGPKEVYKETIAEEKGKPPGTPGNGPPDKPPKEPEPEPDPSVDKWAVIIGISDYRGKTNDLQYCDDDAVDMYNYLLSRGYPEGNIQLLLDREAKAKAIMKAIDWLNSWENEGSEVVFFYSGHGSTYDGYNDGDEEYTDEAIVSADLYLILDGQLKAKFSTFSSTKISITFDSCFSGGMDDLTVAGRVVVTACSELQLSYDGTSTQQNGVFTYYYVNGLVAYNTIEAAFSYAEPLASNFAEINYGAQMNPQIHDLYTGEWAF